MDLTTLVVAILAVAGIIWGYPKLPYPWNLVIVAVVVIVCVWILLNLAGIPVRLHA